MGESVVEDIVLSGPASVGQRRAEKTEPEEVLASPRTSFNLKSKFESA